MLTPPCHDHLGLNQPLPLLLLSFLVTLTAVKTPNCAHFLYLSISSKYLPTKPSLWPSSHQKELVGTYVSVFSFCVCVFVCASLPKFWPKCWSLPCWPNRKGASWSYLIGSLGPNFPPDKVTSWIICEQYSEVHMPSTLLAFTSPKREPVGLSSPSCQPALQSNLESLFAKMCLQSSFYLQVCLSHWGILALAFTSPKRSQLVHVCLVSLSISRCQLSSQPITLVSSIFANQSVSPCLPTNRRPFL